MRMPLLGLVMLAALFVLAAQPQAQPLADDPIIPLPISQTSPTNTDTPLAGTTSPSPQPAGLTTLATPSPTPQPAQVPAARSGAIQLPSTAFQACYLFSAPSDTPEAVVLWRAIGQGAQFDPHEVRERISLQTGPKETLKGIYTLQPDYRIQKVSLPPADVDHVFDLLHADTQGTALATDPTWKAKIAGNLKEVEFDAERPKELRKLAAQRARQAKTPAAKSPAKSVSCKVSSQSPARVSTRNSTGIVSKKSTSPAAGKPRQSTKSAKPLARR